MGYNLKIYEIFNKFSKILELYNESKFKVSALQRAIFFIKKTELNLTKLSLTELKEIKGIGISLASYIDEINKTGHLKVFEDYVEKTPKGIFDLFKVNGLGPKKIKLLWEVLNINTLKNLLEACENNSLKNVKGFTYASQEKLKEEILFVKTSLHKCLLPTAEILEQKILLIFKNNFPSSLISNAGEIRRKLDVISKLDFVIGTDNMNEVLAFIKSYKDFITIEEKIYDQISSIECKLVDNEMNLLFHITTKKHFSTVLIFKTGSEKHTKEAFDIDDSKILNEKFLSNNIFANNRTIKSEKDFYDSFKLQYIEPELREGSIEVDLAKKGALPKLIEYQDIQGILHLHTTFSDGMNTLETMAKHIKSLGFQYMGVTDHSKSAFYAGGLQKENIVKQHEEVENLNRELAPFKIFKGIESDILKDGSLDYDDKILKSFDFIIGSIHSNFNLNEKESTARLIKAIENPYLTILGHPTGRLLLRRRGYPIDHKKVIDACAKNNVVIEINSNPNRLDLDWRWIKYAIDKGSLLSINPDAHSTLEIFNIQYGIYMARKGFATSKDILSACSLKEFEKILKSKAIS